MIGTTVQDVLPGGMTAASGLDEQKYADRMDKAFHNLMEAAFDIGDAFVDPDERFRDPETGKTWEPLTGEDPKGSSSPLWSESRLTQARSEGRRLAVWNEYAINGHENRINYVVGTGHTYTAVLKDNLDADASDSEVDAGDEKTAAAQVVLDEFVKNNKWHKRQQEIQRRNDRDGESFLRFFKNTEKGLLVRMIEPSQVFTPNARTNDPDSSMGIQNEPGDVEMAIGYWVDDKLILAEEVQHRKLGVDANVKRGIPLYFACSKDLARADTIQKNMSVMSTIQSAIAMIRKHAMSNANAISNFVADNADVRTTNPLTGGDRYHRKYGPGTVLDADGQIEYEFPSARTNPAVFLPVRDGILRSVASRLVMPEFMLTSNASNANYSSTLVAEGPAVKQFARMQQDTIDDDLEVLDLALDFAVEQRKLSQENRDAIEIDVIAPQLAVRNRLEEVKADQILVQSDAMSPQTMSVRHDLDPDHEQALIDKNREKNDPFAGMENPLLQGQVPGQVPNPAGNEDEEQ